MVAAVTWLALELEILVEMREYSDHERVGTLAGMHAALLAEQRAMKRGRHVVEAARERREAAERGRELELQRLERLGPLHVRSRRRRKAKAAWRRKRDAAATDARAAALLEAGDIRALRRLESSRRAAKRRKAA